MDAIVAYDLSKQYGDSFALNGLNLQVPHGCAMACVGKSNSGKTTLIRLLAGLCRPTMGECTVMGLSPTFEADKLHASTGVVLDSARLYDNMTLSENLRFFSGINNMDDNDALDRASFLLHKLGIWEARDDKVDDLPTGVVRRASLARALMHSPRVLLIDEPEGGLDQETATGMRELFSYLLEEEGITLLLATSNMAYAQTVCSSFSILKDGILVAKGSLDALRKGAGLSFSAALRLADGEKGPSGFKYINGYWQKEIASEADMPKIISQVVNSGTNLYEVKFVEPAFGEIYEAYMEGGKRKAGDLNEQESDEQQEDTATSPEEQDIQEQPAGEADSSGGEEI